MKQNTPSQSLGRFFLLYVLCAMILAYFTYDIYLPALPGMRIDFSTSITAIQALLSLYMLGLAIIQFFIGPFIDYFGYRKIALIMVALFGLVSLATVFVHRLDVFIVLRFLQAFSAGASAVTARACLPRNLSGNRLTNAYLIVSPLMALSPALAPALGGYLSSMFSWRACSVFMVGFSVVIFFLTYRYQHTGPVFPNAIGLNPKKIAKQYWQIVSSTVFCTRLSVTTIAFFVYYGFLAESPFLLHHLGYVDKQIGCFYLLFAAAFVLATQLVRVANRFFSSIQTVRIAWICSTISLAMLVSFAIEGLDNAWVIMLPMTLFCFFTGFVTPTCLSEVAAAFPEQAGSAAGLVGVFILSSAAIASNIIQPITHGSLLILSIILFILSTIAMVIYSLLRE